MQGNLVITSYFMQQISYDFMKNIGKDAVQNLAHCK